MTALQTEVAIIGGGIIGLSTAWQLARAGVEVCVLERSEAGKSASWAAAGMLAPQAEVGFEEINFLRLGQESLALYPKFLEELREDSGLDVQLDMRGTLMIALDRDDREALRREFEFRKSIGLAVEWITTSEARELEPLLSPKVTSAIWLPNDYQIDNQGLILALRKALIVRGGKLYEQTAVERVEIDQGKVVGVVTRAGDVNAKSVVLAAGAWSHKLAGLPEEVRPAVRPVKGQILTLKMTEQLRMTKVVRSPRVYLAPKLDSRLIIGATSEEKGFDTVPTAGGVLTLLEEAFEAVPAIYELSIEEIRVGLRPGSRDNEPLIGESLVKNLFIATGHYRHGILLAPVTAKALVAMIQGEPVSKTLLPFRPSRFLTTSTTTA
ncbi:MAG: glycine oxidase ThiO [[Chlorobium] sp. 445]|nr:MAG: glycine oxidase ThiO [[Chlorobium] sp. 445]